MTVNKFIYKMMRFKPILRVIWFHMQVRKRTLVIGVKPHKNGRECPKCGKKGKLVKSQRKERRWRDIPFCGWTVYLSYVPREIMCSTHGRIQECIPWADSHSRCTYRYEWALVTYCKMMTQKASASMLRVSTSTLSDQLHAIIKRSRKGHKIRGLRKIGVDEISYAKGRKFATIVYDMERSRVVWIGKGKGKETINRFFNEKLSSWQKERITHASCDMATTYINALKEHCKNAELVLDRFHVVKALNDAVDELRKEQWRKMSKSERKAVKGLRWILYKHPSNRTNADRALLKRISKSNRRLWRAAVLKDEFNIFWDFDSSEEAEAFLKAWSTTALKSRIPSLRTFVETVRKYLPHIVAFVNSRITNATAEGINRIIKIVKNRASGFRSLSNFEDLIYLVVGDLDIPEHIRTTHRVPVLL